VSEGKGGEFAVLGGGGQLDGETIIEPQLLLIPRDSDSGRNRKQTRLAKSSTGLKKKSEIKYPFSLSIKTPADVERGEYYQQGEEYCFPLSGKRVLKQSRS